MNISEYAEKARSVKVYPAAFTYPALGLAGEIGEVLDKITSCSHHSNVSKDDVVKEIGDALWYVVNTAADAGLSFNDIVDGMTGGLRADNFTEANAQIKRRIDTRSSLVKLPIHAGRIAEVAKKMIRDSDGVMPENKLPIVKESLVEILVCLFDIADLWSINFDDVARANINKLFSRKARGVLQGSGDDR